MFRILPGEGIREMGPIFMKDQLCNGPGQLGRGSGKRGVHIVGEEISDFRQAVLRQAVHCISGGLAESIRLVCRSIFAPRFPSAPGTLNSFLLMSGSAAKETL